MMKWMRNTGLLLLMCMLIPLSAWAGALPDMADGDSRVFDQASLFTDSDIAELESSAAAIRKTIKMDVVIVTSTDAGGKNSRNYADDFYEKGGFGTGKNHNGVLFLIDMDNRELYISTEGDMIRFLTDDRINTMLDHVYDYAGQAQYAEAAKVFLVDTLAYYHKGIPGGDTETGTISRYYSIRWYEVLIALSVSVGCGLLACLNVKRQYAMKAERKQAGNYNMAYRANASFAFRNRNDVLTNTFTTKRVIPRSTGSSGGSRTGGSTSGRSSTHRSSSGRSHGGGGRKF
ncbi:MAG: TPM domain-containing protein [Lachnospiraceae bacterium]